MITKIGAAALQQKDNADERPGLGHLATGLGALEADLACSVSRL